MEDGPRPSSVCLTKLVARTAVGFLGPTSSQFFQLPSFFFRSTASSCARLPHALHHFGRSLRQKLLIRQLPLAVGDFFLDLLQLFLQALALSANVNLLFVNYVNIEPRRGAGPGQVGQ